MLQHSVLLEAVKLSLLELLTPGFNAPAAPKLLVELGLVVLFPVLALLLLLVPFCFSLWRLKEERKGY